jgi:hypothetical protein
VCWVRRGPWGQLQDLPDGVEADLALEGLGELPELLAAWRAGGFDEEAAEGPGTGSGRAAGATGARA